MLRRQLLLHSSLLVRRAAHPTLPTRSCRALLDGSWSLEDRDGGKGCEEERDSGKGCDCCAALQSARRRLVDAVPRGGKRLLDGMKQENETGKARKCEHVLLPKCRAYQYSVSAGGDRVTVVATVENPYVDEMRAVSLCLSAVGIHTDCRSIQVKEIPAGEQREVAATATFASSGRNCSSSDSWGHPAMGWKDGPSGHLDDIVVECLVVWESPLPSKGGEGRAGGSGGGLRGAMEDHANVLLSLSISPEERLITPVPGPHTLKRFPWELAVSATVCICQSTDSGWGAGRGYEGGGMEALKGHKLMQMLAALFNGSASSQAPPPGTTALYVSGGGSCKDEADVSAARSNVWVALGLNEEGARCV